MAGAVFEGVKDGNKITDGVVAVGRGVLVRTIISVAVGLGAEVHVAGGDDTKTDALLVGISVGN